LSELRQLEDETSQLKRVVVTGRRFRTFNAMDAFTRKGLAREVEGRRRAGAGSGGRQPRDHP
jgi:hypothetical protein